MDLIVYVSAAVVVLILLTLLLLLKKFTSDATKFPVAANEDADVVGAGRGVARPRGPGAGGVRRRGPRGNRLAEARRQGAEGSDDEGAVVGDVQLDLPDEKIGAKKLRKLQEKAERKAQHEAELREREERKRQEAIREEQRKKQEAEDEAEEAARLKEEKKRKEEEERREHEEYLKLKEAFVVEEEGTNEEELNADSESILQEFINYIQEMKVVMLEDLAAHFKLKTQDAIDRVTTLRDEGRLSGVLDDRGKFIYITKEEYEAVAKFIRQRGRVSISELAESSNKLINLNPDNKETMHKKLLSDMNSEVAAC